jgi:hypothetical protein
MIRKPKDDSIVYEILTALCNRSTCVLMNDHTMSIRFENGRLSIVTPYRIILNRMFKLCDESSIIVSSDVKVFKQEYILDENLLKYSNRPHALKTHYEKNYLYFH